MAVPRSRLSNQRKNKRRSHLAKKPSHTVPCSNCKAPKASNTICQGCGFFGSKQVLTVETEG